MSANFTVLDIHTLVKVTGELYVQCQPIIKDAPDEFRSLVQELGLMRRIVQTLEHDFCSKTPYLQRMGEGRKVVLERCLNACLQTLQQFRVLLLRYQELGIGEEKQFWQRFKWIAQKAQFEDLRSKIMVHTCNLSLCTGSIMNSRLQKSMREEVEVEEDPNDSFSFTSADSDMFTLTQSRKDGDFSEHEQPRVQPPRRLRPKISPRMLGRRPRISTSSDLIASRWSRGTSQGGLTPTLPLSFGASEPHNSEPINGRISRAQHRSDKTTFEDSPYEDSIDNRILEDIYWERKSDNQSLHGTIKTPSVDFGYDNVMEAVDRAISELNQVRFEEQVARPPQYVSQNKLHRPDSDTIKAFEASINGESQTRSLGIREWLNIATWWLLKAKTTLANCSRHTFVNARGSMRPSTDLRTDSQQAYANLLKASYIIYNIVLLDENSSALLLDENRKSIVDITVGINEELSQFTVDIPDPSMLLSQNLDIWEPLQSEEALGLTEFSRTENTRWIAVHQDDAGNEDEKVLYRTFVNAAIGSKKFRIRTKGAPYILLLTSKEGESEPKIVLLNQSGSLCLQRDCIPEDLPQMIEIANAALTGFSRDQISEPLYLKFDNTSVAISFQFDAEITNFITVPTSYFSAVKLRQPIDSKEFTEMVIFKNSVEMLEQLKMPNLIPLNPPMIIKSCEVRVLERSFSEVWRCMRRMVISLSVVSKAPRCIELFMPLSQVQVHRGYESKQVLLKWSDTCQERSDKTDGNFNTLHSYIYDGSMPNIGMSFKFSTSKVAADFEDAILEINFKSGFAWLQPDSSGRIYNVVDTDTERKQYKAIVLFKNDNSWRYSDIYYIYRDTDIVYDQSFNIKFPKTSYTDYISNHVDCLWEAEFPVGFSHCQLKTGPIAVKFEDEAISREFLSFMSPLYELIYSRCITSLNIKAWPIFGVKKSGKGAARLQIWRRLGGPLQLAARWHDDVLNQWLTMEIPSDLTDNGKGSIRVDFPRLPYSRGVTLDMVSIKARGSKSKTAESQEGYISFIFETCRDKDDFTSILLEKPVQAH